MFLIRIFDLFSCASSSSDSFESESDSEAFLFRPSFIGCDESSSFSSPDSSSSYSEVGPPRNIAPPASPSRNFSGKRSLRASYSRVFFFSRFSRMRCRATSLSFAAFFLRSNFRLSIKARSSSSTPPDPWLPCSPWTEEVRPGESVSSTSTYCSRLRVSLATSSSTAVLASDFF